MFAALKLLMIYIVLGVPVAVIGIPWTLIRRDISDLYCWAMWVLHAGLRFAGIRVEVAWRESLDPSQRYIFLSNHVSNLDPPVLLPLVPGRLSVFIKRSLLKIPVIGYGMRLGGFIAVDRDGRVESAKESVDAAVRVLDSGVNILSFVRSEERRVGKECRP